MIVLGLNAYGHDAAAVLLVDGSPRFAASEERFDRVRHSAAFPARAIAACLAASGCPSEDVDRVAFPWSRGMARMRKAVHVLAHLPRSRAFLREPPDDLVPDRRTYLRSMATLSAALRAAGLVAPLTRVPHHLAHAASARLVLPDGEGAVLTADGMGEWTTAAAWASDGAGIERVAHASYPHSPGKAYAAVTQWLGFRPESDEGKTMGLAGHGDPDAPGARFARSLVRPDDERLLRVATSAFGFPWGERRLYGSAFLDALGPARPAGGDLRPGDADVARGIQDAVEEFALAAGRRWVSRLGARALALAGGLFLNCAMNGRLAREVGVPVFPFPVAGDAGAAWGAAAWVHERETGKRAAALDTLRLGTEIPGSAGSGPAAEVAARIARGEVVAVARGRAELGPRALGGRSVLASPRTTASRDRVNSLKGREAWRPLAPVVLEGEGRWFPDLRSSPHMILTAVASEEARREIPGAVHVDGTARVQTVGPAGDPFLRTLLERLPAEGHPAAVLNTSLNRPGEPIADTAEQAVAAARAMRLDAIVVGDDLLQL